MRHLSLLESFDGHFSPFSDFIIHGKNNKDRKQPQRITASLLGSTSSVFGTDLALSHFYVFTLCSSALFPVF